MPHIDEVTYARMVVAGKVYRAATIVYPDSVNGRWWRKDGMKFSPEDFEEVISRNPEAVVLGIGFSAKVTVPAETEERFAREGIACHIADTPEAVEQFNSLSKTKRVVGAFYLM